MSAPEGGKRRCEQGDEPFDDLPTTQLEGERLVPIIAWEECACQLHRSVRVSKAASCMTATVGLALGQCHILASNLLPDSAKVPL